MAAGRSNLRPIPEKQEIKTTTSTVIIASFIYIVIINMILHLHNLIFIGQRMFYKIGIRSPFLGR